LRTTTPHSDYTKIDVLIGTVLCAVTALIFTLAFLHVQNRVLLPLLFIAVLVLVSLRFSAWSAVFGGVAAALIFAYFLFLPVGSLRVDRAEARSNLGWMLLVGIPASYFVGAIRHDDGEPPPPKPGGHLTTE